jgi:putative nucleotidyltransferase with HDIG domain
MPVSDLRSLPRPVHTAPQRTEDVTSPAPTHPTAFRLYYGAVVVAAAALLVLGTPAGLPPRPWLMAAVLGLMIFSDWHPVRLPSGGYATGSGAFDLPCLALFGPAYTAWIGLASTVFVESVQRRRAVVRVIHNLGVFTLTYFAAGATYVALGGVVGTPRFPHDVAPLLAAGGVYFLVNSALVSTVIGLTDGPSPLRVWQSNFLRGLVHHLSFVALGTLVTVVVVLAGGWGVVLLTLPFLVARHSFRLYMEIKSDLKDFVRALTEVLEEVDPYTRHHSVRVAQYATRLARGLGLAERHVEEVEYAALVHDLGKIGPQHQYILQKPGSLSHEEQRTLRSHPAAGAEIVARVRALRRAAEIVRSHHERPDGLGYPYGLKSEDVPIGARILNVADAFDAMTSDRPYRRALTVDAALSELRRGAGTQFDAEVVRCLLRLHAAGRCPLVPSPSSEDLRLLRVRPLRQA